MKDERKARIMGARKSTKEHQRVYAAGRRDDMAEATRLVPTTRHRHLRHYQCCHPLQTEAPQRTQKDGVCVCVFARQPSLHPSLCLVSVHNLHLRSVTAQAEYRGRTKPDAGVFCCSRRRSVLNAVLFSLRLTPWMSTYVPVSVTATSSPSSSSALWQQKRDANNSTKTTRLS